MEFRKSPNEQFLSGAELLLDYMDNMTYRYEPKAPSFLMRLQDDASNSTCCGIESFINPAMVSEMGLSQESESYVDYCYFSPYETCRDAGYDAEHKIYLVRLLEHQGLQGIMDRFKLDSYHARILGVSLSSKFCRMHPSDETATPVNGGGCEPG